MPNSKGATLADLRARIGAIEGGSEPSVSAGAEVGGTEHPEDVSGASDVASEVRTTEAHRSAAAAPVRNFRRSAAASYDAKDAGQPATGAGRPDVSSAEDAFRRIERLSAMRDHAVEELRRRLLREDRPEEAVEEALERAVRCGLLDDARFAETLVRSRLSAGRGIQGIEAELARWGIDACCIPGWPDEFTVGEEGEVQRALALLDRKPPRCKNLREGAYRRLMQKGFGSSVAARAARLWSERHTTG